MLASNDILKAEEEFSRYHEKLRRELNMIYWHFRVLEYIKEIQNNYNEELKQTPTFWGLTINAHLVYVLTRLNNFFGKKEKEKHLHMYSFLDFIEKHLYIFSNQAFEKRLRMVGRYDELASGFNSEITATKVQQDKQKIGILPITSLKAWRNKILSHIDKNDIAKNVDVAKKHPIRMEHLNTIINTLHEMLNEYSLSYDFLTHSKDLTFEQGIQYILDAIRLKRQS